MKKKIVCSLFIASLLMAALSSCGGPTKDSFTIIWQNYDGAFLEQDSNVPKGEVPTYDGSKPSHKDDESHYYVFKGWSPEVKEASDDVTYVAQFEAHDLFSVNEQPDDYADALPSNIEDGNILHAFCWTFNDIKHNLPYIAEAGFRSVQVSPVQTPKSNGSAWWAFYQPLSFTIAEESSLGTKQEFIDLCEEADRYNIGIIVDVVFNHLANISDNDLESDGTPMVSPLVANYEPEIYAHRNDSENPTFHHNPKAKGSGAETQYYQYGKLPDLNTGNELVQQRCLSFLKECIDAGADGFRFDAAKHIETPDDKDYPSDFWPNTLGVAKEYYKSKNSGKELFAYGEILGGVSGRELSAYTKYMKITENNYCTGLINGIASRNTKSIINASNGKNVEETNLVTWVESHDTYVEDSNPWSDYIITQAWAALSAKKDKQNLFLARPDDARSVGIIANYNFKNEAIGAVNRFHNRFVHAEEYQSSDGAIYINERVQNNDKGVIVVDTAKSRSIIVDFTKLGTGVYYDQISGKSVVVRNGHATIELHSSGVSVLTKSKNLARPSFEISEGNGSFFKEKTLTVTSKNATNCSYQINDNEPISFEKKVDIKLEDTMAIDGVVKLTIRVANEQFEVSEVFSYNSVTLIEGKFNIVNIKQDYIDNYELYLWTFGGGDPGTWRQDYEISGTTMLVDVESLGIGGFVLCLFAKDYVPADLHKWDNNVLKQTVDIAGNILAQGYYDAYRF